MIVASSYYVYPREIEEVLFEYEAVAEAVAIGIPDEYRGETVKAFVVKRLGDGGGGTRLLQGAPRRLQVTESGRVPRGATQECRGQAPPSRSRRRGAPEDG